MSYGLTTLVLCMACKQKGLNHKNNLRQKSRRHLDSYVCSVLERPYLQGEQMIWGLMQLAVDSIVNFFSQAIVDIDDLCWYRVCQEMTYPVKSFGPSLSNFGYFEIMIGPMSGQSDRHMSFG